MSPNKDKTGNDRQRRRREREKVWLKEHGFESWEALHTALMNGETSLTPLAPDGADVCHIVTHVFIDGTCAMCGVPEPRPAGNANRSTAYLQRKVLVK